MAAKTKKPAPKRERHYQEDGAYARRMAKRRASEDAETSDDNGAPADAKFWWNLDGKQLADAAWGWAERLKSRNRRQAMMDALWEAVYKDAPIGSSMDAARTLLRTREARQNIVMSMVDTLRARIGKRRPMPVISADDAGPAEKLFAKRASRVLRRKLGSAKLARMRPLMARDGLIRGTGVIKGFIDGGDVGYELVPRRELLVDPAEAQYGEPRSMGQLKRVDRTVLTCMFPDSAEDIRTASRATRDEWRLQDETSDADMVEVLELWRLPSVPGAGDGKHAICIRGKDPLRCEEWKVPRFPFGFFQFNEALDGFWGTGLVEHAAPIQQEVNGMLRQMGEGITQGMALKIFSPRGSNVVKHHLRATNPVVIEHDGPVPTYQAPLPFNPAVLSYLQWRIQQAYEMAGISQSSAASKNPLGNQASGKALDTMYDLESDRFSHVELQYAMNSVDLGHVTLDLARMIAEDDTIEDKAPWISEIEWKKVEVDGGLYHLVLEPINFLPDSRSGKLAQVKEMGEAGLLQSPEQTAALFDEPDLARANRYMLGPYKMLERWCEDLADPGIDEESLTPTPLHVAYIEMARKMVQGELANQIAEAKRPPSEDDELIQGRLRWALQMLDGEANGVGPTGGAGVPMPAPMPGDPAAAMPPGAPMPPPGPGLDPMGGLTSQLAAGMPAPQGLVM